MTDHVGEKAEEDDKETTGSVSSAYIPMEIESSYPGGTMHQNAVRDEDYSVYCDSCGDRIRLGNTFCPNCGESIGDIFNLDNE